MTKSSEWGRSDPPPEIALKAAERFWRRVEKSDGCWMWNGAGRKRGGDPAHSHGQFFCNGNSIFAHRMSYILNIGPIPRGKIICHTCDRGLCVNPAHLYVGDHSTNGMDSVRRGRHKKYVAHGSAHSLAKISDDDCAEIRRLFATGKYTKAALGKMFGVVRTVIYEVIAYRSHRAVGPASIQSTPRALKETP